jgi:hypothetical protein
MQLRRFLELQRRFLRDGKADPTSKDVAVAGGGKAGNHPRPVELPCLAQKFWQLLEFAAELAIAGPGRDYPRDGGERGDERFGRSDAEFRPGGQVEDLIGKIADRRIGIVDEGEYPGAGSLQPGNGREQVRASARL